MRTDAAPRAVALSAHSHGFAWSARLTGMACLATLLSCVAAGIADRRGPGVEYLTLEVTRGDLAISVSTEGTLRPLQQVHVSSEISGTVRGVHVAPNQVVRAGDLLATIDTSRLDAELRRAQASLAVARARVRQSESEGRSARALYARLLTLSYLTNGALPSGHDLDRAEARVSWTLAEEVAAKAAADRAKAALATIRVDIGKASIRSPISGIVLVQAAKAGQTIAATHQAPVLFVIASNLRTMQLHAWTSEADIGLVHPGQDATFSVKAFPEDQFPARLIQVHPVSHRREDSTASSGSRPTASPQPTDVVFYETVFEVDNRDFRLRPGMTAAALVSVRQLHDVMLVPNEATRFVPDDRHLPKSSTSGRGIGMTMLLPSVPERWSCPRVIGEALACVWMLENDRPALAIFRAGGADRHVTQVMERGPLHERPQLARLMRDRAAREAIKRQPSEGMRVIVGTRRPAR